MYKEFSWKIQNCRTDSKDGWGHPKKVLEGQEEQDRKGDQGLMIVERA